jgi:poly(3-hydroxybutyrate) depolymerase
LRGTAQTLLTDHDVYITDWHNARDIALPHGGFGFGEFIDHFITFLQVLGPGVHVVGVCQPCVAVLAAVAIMAEDSDPAQPRSMMLMAGPIDARVSPTEVDRLATSRPIDWFERNLIGIVPLRYAGALRRVYPGSVQLAAFMSMNFDRHVKAQIDLFYP